MPQDYALITNRSIRSFIWYPSLTQIDIDMVEVFQKRCLKTIFPHIDGSDKQLEEGNLARLTTYSSDICDKYAQKVINGPNANQTRNQNMGDTPPGFPTRWSEQQTEFRWNSLFHKHFQFSWKFVHITWFVKDVPIRLSCGNLERL